MAERRVRDLMHIGVPTCQQDTLLADAAAVLLREHAEALVVLDANGNATGRVGRWDVVAACARPGADSAWRPLTAADVARPDIPEVKPEIPASTAVQMMLDQGERELYLLHYGGGGRWPAAVLRLEDILREVCAATDSLRPLPAD